MKHLAPLIERLQDKANWQQEYMEEIFNGMEAVGLHWILKKHFVRDNGTIRTRRRVKFNSPRSYNKYSLYRQRSTPYPPALLSKYVSSSDDSLPTGNYQTVSRYPLEGGFIHHYVQPVNPGPSTSTTVPKQEQIATIQANQQMPKVTMDWINYQGGMGLRFNPIIVEDDWFGGINGLVQGIVMIVLTFIFFDTLFAALCANDYCTFFIHDTLPQCSLVSFFFCSIFIYIATTQPYALLPLTHCHNAALLLFIHSHSLESI